MLFSRGTIDNGLEKKHFDNKMRSSFSLGLDYHHKIKNIEKFYSKLFVKFKSKTSNELEKMMNVRSKEY